MNPHIFTCEPEWEAVVADELCRVFRSSTATTVGDGWVAVESDRGGLPARPFVAFGSQCLPDARSIDAGSIAAWVQVVGPQIVDGLRDHSGPWRLHVFGVYRVRGEIGRPRAALIERGLVEFLKKKQRRLLRLRIAGVGLFGNNEALVQVGLVKKSSGFLSIAGPETLLQMRGCVSPFCGGIVDIPPDRRAPSRAFAKLLEAKIRIGRRIEAGESCVDLGSSPGSWAYVALQRGAKVVAVDRSPRRADLMRHPSLAFVRGDAFRFEPQEPADWLLCDVIAYPDRVFELIKRWIEQKWCRQFCVTIKF
ncbi:MAG TPA: SAM-dependent methyltransferase, partial [Pirellulales bacterium]